MCGRTGVNHSLSSQKGGYNALRVERLRAIARRHRRRCRTTRAGGVSRTTRRRKRAARYGGRGHARRVVRWRVRADGNPVVGAEWSGIKRRARLTRVRPPFRQFSQCRRHPGARSKGRQGRETRQPRSCACYLLQRWWLDGADVALERLHCRWLQLYQQKQVGHALYRRAISFGEPPLEGNRHPPVRHLVRGDDLGQ